MTNKWKTARATRLTALGLTVVLVGFVLWFVYQSNQWTNGILGSANKVAQSETPVIGAVTSFEDCKRAGGSKMLLTSPEQCVTAGGESFTEGQKVLIIKEWGVKFTYVSDDILSYKMGNPANTVAVISQNLSLLEGCDSWGAGVINRESGTARNGMVNTGETIAQSYAKDPSLFVKVGGKYYRFVSDTVGCPGNTGAPSAAQKAANDFVKALVPKLQAVK